MQFRSRAQTGHRKGGHEWAGREPVPNPPSTAWVAAQQAFSPTERLAADQPVVIVRKGRVLAAGAAAFNTVHSVAPLSAPADKPARVFRVASAAAASDQAAESERVEPGPQGELATAADLPRRRRIAVEKRPGPVLSIVHAVPAVVETQPPAPGHAPLLPLDGVGAVIELFASVDAILDDIQRARAFRFVDADFTGT